MNGDAGIMEMKGMSSSENSLVFYKPILEYLDNCNETDKAVTTVDFSFKYFNTSSAKCILDVLERFADLKQEGKSVKVNWYFETLDEEMQGAGENFSAILDLPINIIEKKA